MSFDAKLYDADRPLLLKEIGKLVAKNNELTDQVERQNKVHDMLLKFLQMLLVYAEETIYNKEGTE